MTAKRENMIDEMIKIYGFENPIVIEFARLCEWEVNEWNDRVLEILCEAHKASPVIE